MKWKFKCLVGVAYLPVPAFWKEISTILMDKKKLNETECYGVETIVKFCSKKSSYQDYCTDISQGRSLEQLS